MVSANVKVVNPMGMHMRPAQLFIKEVTPFGCDVTIVFNGKEINGKSIMNLMAACIKQGSEIEIRWQRRPRRGVPEGRGRAGRGGPGRIGACQYGKGDA